MKKAKNSETKSGREAISRRLFRDFRRIFRNRYNED